MYISYHFQDIESYLSIVANFSPLHLHLALMLGWPDWNFTTPLVSENYSSRAIMWHCLQRLMFCHF